MNMKCHLRDTRQAEHRSLEGIHGAMTVHASRSIADSYCRVAWLVPVVEMVKTQTLTEGGTSSMAIRRKHVADYL